MKKKNVKKCTVEPATKSTPSCIAKNALRDRLLFITGFQVSQTALTQAQTRHRPLHMEATAHLHKLNHDWTLVCSGQSQTGI